MIVKNRFVSSRRVSRGKASSSLKSHLKYLQFRQRDEQQERRQDRYLFDQTHDHVTRAQAHDRMMQEPAGHIYYHRLLLSPSRDEPVTDWRAWTRAVMQDLEQRLEVTLSWVAVQHHNTENPHVHVVLHGTGRSRETDDAHTIDLKPPDFTFLKERGREHSEYAYYHHLQATLSQLEQRDTLTQEPPLREYVHTFDWDR